MRNRGLLPSSLAALLMLSLAGCSGPTNSIDEVAALYSNTQVISNIEYRKIDSTSLLLDVYVPMKRLGEPPYPGRNILRTVSRRCCSSMAAGGSAAIRSRALYS